MKLFCLYQGLNRDICARLQHLESAAHRSAIEFEAVDSEQVNYAAMSQPKPGDLLYNCARGSEFLETLLLRDNISTFYVKQPSFIAPPVDSLNYALVHQKHGLRAPKTVYALGRDRTLLREHVDYLGGFPIILKARSSTLGLGTIKVDSWQNLISLADYLCSSGAKFVMRQFVSNRGTARIVVLGDEVLASEFRDNLAGDFRVSGGPSARNYYPNEFSAETNQLAIDAVRLANLDTGGVDIIFDKDGLPYLLEVNFPHNFTPPQEVTGIDIAGAMILWLKTKSRQLHPGEDL